MSTIGFEILRYITYCEISVSAVSLYEAKLQVMWEGVRADSLIFKMGVFSYPFGTKFDNYLQKISSNMSFGYYVKSHFLCNNLNLSPSTACVSWNFLLIFGIILCIFYAPFTKVFNISILTQIVLADWHFYGKMSICQKNLTKIYF